MKPSLSRIWQVGLLILISIFLGIMISSCSSNYNNSAEGALVRVKILENETITWVYLTEPQSQVFREKDMVWVDMTTHTINDTSDTAMMGVLLK